MMSKNKEGFTYPEGVECEYTFTPEEKKKRLKQKEIGRRQRRNRLNNGKRSSTRSRDPY